MADETGVEDILKSVYNVIGETMGRAEQTMDVVGSALRLGDYVPGLSTAAKLTKGIATGK
ncbi:hypothetical protein ACWGR4_28145 [Embleya sp. NPDC055664]